MNFYEKTSPSQISDFIADDSKQIRRLEMLVKNELTFPSDAKKCIILHGRYGAGKTALAKLLPRMIEKHRSNGLIEEAFSPTFHSCSTHSPGRALDLATPTTKPLFASKHYVILDEFDNLASNYQKSLKSFITEYNHVIYIMTTNHLDKIDVGIRSRSHLISFENPSVDLWLKRCVQICEMYDVAPDERYLKDFIRRNRCDARNIMSALEEHIMLAV